MCVFFIIKFYHFLSFSFRHRFVEIHAVLWTIQIHLRNGFFLLAVFENLLYRHIVATQPTIIVFKILRADFVAMVISMKLIYTMVISYFQLDN